MEHQGTLSSIAATAPQDTALSILPAIFTLLAHITGTSPRSRPGLLANLPLAERPSLVVCVETTYPHIRFLWGVEYMMPSFTQPTPKYGKVLVFTRDMWKGQLPTTVKINLK